MEQYKKAHKKVGKKVKESKLLKINWKDNMLGRWVEMLENELVDTKVDLEDLRTSVGRMRVAFWAMFIFVVVFTLSFLLVLYGNQYLVK